MSTDEYLSILVTAEAAEAQFDHLTELLAETLDSTEMNLRVWGSALNEYSDLITEYIQDPDTADWEELEKRINIYLSE